MVGRAGGRAENLDALRAVAALYVLAGHAYLLSGSAIGFHDRRPVHLAINTGGAGVWLFFALSGFLITRPFVAALLSGEPLPDGGAYGVRRAARILPAYWIAFAAVLLLGRPPGTDVSLFQLVSHGLLVHNLVPGEQQALFFASWTLTLEALFYLAVPIVAVVIRRFRPRPIAASVLVAALLVIWAASIVFVGLAAEVDGAKASLWLRILFPSMVSMFCPGVLVAIAVSVREQGGQVRWFELITGHRRRAAIVVAGLCVAGAYGATVHSLRLYDASRQLFAIGFGILLVLAITRPPLGGWIGRSLAWLGTISYGIYLWQGVVIYVLERHPQWIPMHHTGGVAYVVHVAVLLGLTIPLAWLSWRLVERPMIAWSHARERRARTPVAA